MAYYSIYVKWLNQSVLLKVRIVVTFWGSYEMGAHGRGGTKILSVKITGVFSVF